MISGQKRRGAQSGLSMLELMIAMFVMAVGLAGVMILITTSMASNNRNKLDTTATVLSQMVVERIAAEGVNAAATFTITDCLSNSLTIDPRGTTTGQGSPLTGAGEIDFSGTLNPATGFSARYVTCRAGSATATYEIRWNIKILQGTAGSPQMKQVVVATRQIGAAGTGQNRLQFFAPPVTLRTVIGG